MAKKKKKKLDKSLRDMKLIPEIEKASKKNNARKKSKFEGVSQSKMQRMFKEKGLEFPKPAHKSTPSDLGIIKALKSPSFKEASKNDPIVDMGLHHQGGPSSIYATTEPKEMISTVLGQYLRAKPEFDDSEYLRQLDKFDRKGKYFTREKRSKGYGRNPQTERRSYTFSTKAKEDIIKKASQGKVSGVLAHENLHLVIDGLYHEAGRKFKFVVEGIPLSEEIAIRFIAYTLYGEEVGMKRIRKQFGDGFIDKILNSPEYNYKVLDLQIQAFEEMIEDRKRQIQKIKNDPYG